MICMKSHDPGKNFKWPRFFRDHLKSMSVDLMHTMGGNYTEAQVVMGMLGYFMRLQSAGHRIDALVLGLGHVADLAAQQGAMTSLPDQDAAMIAEFLRRRDDSSPAQETPGGKRRAAGKAG